MGSSQKRKNEKKKDFQKQKLKVGKTKPKPTNFTDTSFRSKAVVINQQSLSTAAPTVHAQFAHSVSLLNSKSDTQRRDSLAHLTTSVSARPVGSPLPQPVSVMLPALLPLVLDASKSVRAQLLRLLKALPVAELEGHAAQLLPYIRAGMTHLAADIRMSAIELVSWLVAALGAETVSCAGGWVKTLNCFLALLGWHVGGGGAAASKWTSSTASRASFGKAGTDGKPTAKVLLALAEFLRAGLVLESEDEMGEAGSRAAASPFPISDSEQHLLSSRGTPYAYLNLFGAVRDEEDETYETVEDRLRVYRARFGDAVKTGLAAAKQEGGEAGRASAVVAKVLREVERQDAGGARDETEP
ncbi:rRNA processing protein [Ascosphaera acerosa]|nr:rRNA processing protein [Ascosphaera acerosa]